MKLNATAILDNEQLKDAFSKSFNDLKDYGYHDINTLNTTGVVISWISIDEISQIPLFRIGILSQINGLNLLEENEIYILFPQEYIIDKTKIEDLRKKYNQFIFEGDFNECLNRICILFKEISSNSTLVSDICDIGIICCDLNGFYKINIKDNIDNLISDYPHMFANTKFNIVWSQTI